jgi:hypothetical protein
VSGDRVNGGGNFIEHFRRNADGQVADTQYDLVSRESAYALRSQDPPWGTNDQDYYGNNNYQGGYQGNYQGNYQGYYQGGYQSDGSWTSGRSYSPKQGWQQAPMPPQPPPPGRGFFNMPLGGSNDARQAAPQRDPNYYWGGGRYN